MTLLPTFANLRGGVFRPGRIAGVAVFLLGALVANRADASCGDWLAGHESMQTSPVVHDGDGPSPQAPCDGPQCRRSREHLPVVPPGPSRQLEGPERWCRTAEELAARPPLSSPLSPEATPAAPDGDRPSIERPPRA
ncbi:MAG TPA: hypothetical protein VF170_00310 [Planctomycetaceae bacterium]